MSKKKNYRTSVISINMNQYVNFNIWEFRAASTIDFSCFVFVVVAAAAVVVFLVCSFLLVFFFFSFFYRTRLNDMGSWHLYRNTGSYEGCTVITKIL